MQTSTPLIPSKHEKTAEAGKSCRIQSVSQQLFRNHNEKYKIGENHDGDAQFVNLPSGALQDLFFGQHQEDDSSIHMRHTLPAIVVTTENDDIVSSLKNCSISQVGNSSSTEESTLSAGDDTLKASTSATKGLSKSGNKSNDSDRRLSQITVPSPFSFELREQEKKERKSERLQYKMFIEQHNAYVFKAKPAPKSKPQPKAQNADKQVAKKEEATTKYKQTAQAKIITPLTGHPKLQNVGKIILKQEEKPTTSSMTGETEANNVFQEIPILALEPQPNLLQDIVKPIVEKQKEEPLSSMTGATDAEKMFHEPSTSSSQPNLQDVAEQSVQQEEIPVAEVAEIINEALPSASDIQLQLNGENIDDQIEQEEKSAPNENAVAQKQPGKKDMHPNVSQAKKKVELWKKKPFQVTLPKRTLTIGVSPKLLTAERARNRHAFDERMREREKERETMRKRNAALFKRALPDPMMMPILKRRRHI